MVTILISGAGTGVGKTRVCGALARTAAARGRRVQILKPVQTGVTLGMKSDAAIAAEWAGLANDTAHTLRSYPAALAPLSAAKAAGEQFDLMQVVHEIEQIPKSEVRLVEGAGGLAVPLAESGLDWIYLAQAIGANAVVLVVSDELGAINQARLAYHYFQSRTGQVLGQRLTGGIFLNAITLPPPEIAASTRRTLVDCQVPIWGELAANATEPRLNRSLAELLRL